MQVVLIPSERVKILMGEATRKEIEERGDVKISIGEEGEVQITSKDPVAEWRAIDVVKAIGRGFNPETAFKLFDEEHVLKIISLKDVFPKERQRTRYKARIIGTKGKAKKTIEDITGASLCIYGNTVSIIGKLEEVSLAERAINMIIGGASHGTVYSVLQKERQRLAEIEGL